MFTTAELEEVKKPTDGFIVQYQTRQFEWNDLTSAGVMPSFNKAVMIALDSIKASLVTLPVKGYERRISISAVDICIVNVGTGEIYGFKNDHNIIKIVYPDESEVTTALKLTRLPVNESNMNAFLSKPENITYFPMIHH